MRIGFQFFKKRKQICSGEQEDSSVVCSKKSSENSMDARVKRIRPSFAGKECIDVEGAAEDVQKKKSMAIKSKLPIMLGSACDTRKSSGFKYSSQSNNEEAVKYFGDGACLDEAKLHTVKVTNQFDVEDRSHKEWKGRLHKPVVKSSIISFSENEDDSLMDVEIAKSMDASTLGQVCGISWRKKLMDIQIKQETVSGADTMSLLRIGRGDLLEASINQCERCPLKRGVVSPNSVDEKVAEANCATGIEMDLEKSPNSPFDAQLLTTSIRDDSPTTLDSSRACEARKAQQPAKASGGPMDIIDEAPTRVDEEGGLASEFQCLPFVKTSPLWSTIESVEVFQKRPQKPHFRPLNYCKESLREGLAIGCMVTFSSVVERISKLQFDVPHVPKDDDILETVQELETHGFSIGFVRDRIGLLQNMREKHEKLKEEMEKLSKDMISRNHEKSKIDEEMDKINQQIKGLQGMLLEAVSRKEMKSREIGSVQSKLKGITEGIGSIHQEFDGKGTCLY